MTPAKLYWFLAITIGIVVYGGWWAINHLMLD